MDRNESFFRWKLPLLITLVCVLGTIIVTGIDIRNEERRIEAERATRRDYREIFSLEEQKRLGIIPRQVDTGNYRPPAGDIHKRIEQAIRAGGIDNDLLNKLNEVDYHDILDYMGGPEGF